MSTQPNHFSSINTENYLHFKKSAYNWLCFCRDLPPCYDSTGALIEHTKFGTVYFQTKEARDLAFLFLNGKIMFSYWCMIGDDFDLTRWMFANFPINFDVLPPHIKHKLSTYVDEVEREMNNNISFKLNAGKRVGNYNLAKCRSITDKTDKIFADALNFTDVWSDIELFYSQIVKTDFSTDSIDEDSDD